MGKTKKESNITLIQSSKVINVDYQLLLSERDDLLEAEIGYKRRIEQLEKEATDMLNSFDVLYNENKILRSKLDTPDGAGIESVESYNDVFKDREHLREANKAFKRRIRQLEDDVNEKQKTYNDLYSKHQLLTQRAQLETEFATKARDEKIVNLENDHEKLADQLKMFHMEREQYEYRIAEMDKERNELQNKYDFLATEKLEYHIRCDMLQADRDKLKQKVRDLEEKVPDPEQKAKEDQQFLSLQAQVASLQLVNTDAAKEIYKLQDDIRILTKLKKEKVEMVDRGSSVVIDEKAEELLRIEKENQTDTAKQLEEMKQISASFLKENDRLKSEHIDLLSKVANLELELSQCKNELERKKIEIDDISVLVRGRSSLNDDYVALQEKFKDVNSYRQALENELLQEKRMSKLKIMEITNDLDKLKELFNQEEKDKMKLEGDARRLQDENDTLQKITEAQALELRNMKAQLEQVQNLLEDKNSKYEEMKKVDKETQQEIRESRIELHIVKRKLDEITNEKAGNFGILRTEMENAKTERLEETENLRQETIRLKDEVQRLKSYEFKINTMDAEIRRLMNRLRMTERYRKLPKPKSSNESADQIEIKELKKKQKELEKEKLILLQEKMQWEVIKNKYTDLQMTNRRLNEENKRVRGDLDSSNFKVNTLERKFKKLNVNTDDADSGKQQHATYVEKKKFGQNLVSKTGDTNQKADESEHLKTIAEDKTMKTFVTDITKSRGVRIKLSKSKRDRRKFEHKSVRTSVDTSKMRSKKPILPEIESGNATSSFGKGYQDMFIERFRNRSKLSLL